MGGYSRVTVSGPQRWVDLALPDTVPVAALMPKILGVCLPEEEGNEAAGWVLTTPEDHVLRFEDSLGAAGIADGDVLMLRRETAPSRPQYVDDVRGAVEDRVDESSGFWSHSTTFAFGLLFSALVPLLVLAVMSWLRPSAVYPGVAALGLILTLLQVVVARRRAMHVIADILFVTSAGWGGAVGSLLGFVVTAEPQTQNILILGLAGALIASGVAWTVDQAGLPCLTALAFICLTGGALTAVTLFLDIQQGARALALVLVLCIGGLPRLALVMGGLSALDYRVVNSGGVPTERFEETLNTSDRLLLGVVLGSAVSATAVVSLLLWSGEGTPDSLLVLTLSFLLLLRSRLFARIRHVLPLRVGGVTGVVLSLLHLVQVVPMVAVWIPIFTLSVGAVTAAVSWIKLDDVPQASVSRVLNWIELGLVMVAFATTAWGMGLFSYVADMTS
ncbi:type VII secretion integral membrane protein EccD [Nocardiopsis sp. B62]|uniref:type VII secretion integral membrane protein EccD n=1 Tax=Nocardiopsis sp. B62 TaxID=2824874 RepID=UPI001B37FA6E|nr:type VII secretion integral membrane protein EccD [Nocardiopsis sp. B62]MBQ1083457.1 type VII secretion integral membrane protein EccD [Nocardiopsis sp. B62]